jgi:ketosteroid isomerase-like protein
MKGSEQLGSVASDRAADEAEIRRRIGKLVEAVRAMDHEGVKAIYAPELVSFDIVPPLVHLRAEKKWKNWAEVFEAYEPPLGYEARDLTIVVGDDVAFGHSLNRISGMLKIGKRADYWVRWTTGFRKVDGNWLMVHDHVSVPTDMQTGSSLLNLGPWDHVVL